MVGWVLGQRAMELPGYDAATYGDRFADVYDDWYAEPFDSDTDATVVGLASLGSAVGERAVVLELGAGTGRLAIPLAERGFVVTALDASTAMLDRLRAKPGAERVTPLHGDMADPVSAVGDQRFGLVFVAWNTFFNLTSAAAQQECFTGVAAVLDRTNDQARFVVEAFVPDFHKLDTNRRAGGAVEVRDVSVDRVVLSVNRHDPVSQDLHGSYVEITEAGGVTLRPWHLHYATPDQLDAMAAAAGLRLGRRSAGWANEPFDPTASARHVSVYEVAAGPA